MSLSTEAVSLAQEVGQINQRAWLGGEQRRPAGACAGRDHGLRLGRMGLPHITGGYPAQAATASRRHGRQPTARPDSARREHTPS